jgi:ABC-2 type transport system ATP-binding protein
MVSPAPADPGAAKAVPEFTTPSIEVKHLTKHYGPMVAVNDVSFQVYPGEVVGFLGPNGAGKSTTLRILCGLLTASSGEAWVCGHSVAREPDQVKNIIGYMPEQNPLPEDVRVQEYLRLRGRLKNLSGHRLKSRVEAAMDMCDLSRKARRKLIGTLSKGFRQRVGLADALLAEPRVVVLDEPTIGLDPHQIRTVRELITKLRGRMTVILSSHILSEIEMCCDKVIIINQGQVVASGYPKDLRKTYFPAHEFILEADAPATPEPLQEAFRREGHSVVVTRMEDQPGRSGQRFCLSSESYRSSHIPDSWVTIINSVTGGKIRRLESVDPSLEDIFLAATRRTWDEARDPKAVPVQAPAETGRSRES